MDIEIWQIWVIVSLFLFIVEIFMPTFLAACIAFGCFASGLMACIGLGVQAQLTSFSIVTLAVFFGIRPFMLRYAHGKAGQVKTNAEALIGKTGMVIREIDNSKKIGRISIDGDEWRAEGKTDERIGAGERVVIVQITSTLAIVKKINREN